MVAAGGKGAGTGAGAGAAFGSTAAGAAGAAATGAGAGAGGGATIAPSQSTAAVAGVQLASRQHRVPSAFFHCMLPWPERQLSEAVVDPPAIAVPANATDANNIAIVFSFFIFILKIDTTAQAVRSRDSYVVRIAREVIVPQSLLATKFAVTSGLDAPALLLTRYNRAV